MGRVRDLIRREKDPENKFLIYLDLKQLSRKQTGRSFNIQTESEDEGMTNEIEYLNLIYFFFKREATRIYLHNQSPISL